MKNMLSKKGQMQNGIHTVTITTPLEIDENTEQSCKTLGSVAF